MNVLIVPEDFRQDQYILRPLIEAMFKAIEQPRVNVRVCQNPRLGGVSEVLKLQNIEQIINRYRYLFEIFLVIVDRDGLPNRKDQLVHLEAQAMSFLQGAANRVLLAACAWEETETWALAGCADLKEPWMAIRAATNVKEAYFNPYVERRQLGDEPGAGRKTLGLEAARHYKKVRAKCREDLGELERRIKKYLRAPAA